MARYSATAKRLVVTGCLAERYRDELKKEIPEIDAVLGTGEVGDIVGAIESRIEDRGSRIDGSIPMTFRRSKKPDPRTSNIEPRSLPTYLYDAETPARHHDAEALRLRQGRRRLRLHLRVLHHPDPARPVSQPDPRVDRRRGRTLAARGVKELLLISQGHHLLTASTGRSAAHWRPLLRELNTIDGLEWIRMLYSIRPPSPMRSWARGRVRQGLQVRGPAAPARLGRRPQADAPAPATGRTYDKVLGPESATAFPASH